MSEQGAWTATVTDSDLWRPARRRARRLRRRRRRFIAQVESTLQRADASLIALVILLAALVSVAWQSGGYYPTGYLRTGAIAAFGICVLLVLRPPVRRISRSALVAMSALLAFTIWTWVARTWSPAPAAGLANAQRDLVYVVIFTLAVFAAGSGRIAKGAGLAVLGAMLIIVFAGLANRLFTSVHSAPTNYRLAYPLDYWNAYGVLAVMAALLCAGIAADRRAHQLIRSLASAAGLLCLVAMYLSLSRGAWLSLGVGAAVLLLMAPRRVALIGTYLIQAAGLAVALLALRPLPALVDNPTLGQGQMSAAHRFTPELVLLVIGCGVAQLILAHFELVILAFWGERKRAWRPRLPAMNRATTVGILVVIAIGAGVALGPVLSHEISRVWHDTGESTQVPSGSGRLTTLQTSRHDAYRVGFKLFKSAPIVGVGSGGYQAGWYRYRHVDDSIINAHSLYIETLAELGIIGLFLLLGFMGTAIVAAVRARARKVGMSRTRIAASLASVCAYLFHTGIDWDWQMTSVTGLAIVLMAMLMPATPRRPEQTETREKTEQATPAAAEPRTRTLWHQPLQAKAIFGPAALVALLVGIYLWNAGAQANRLASANRLGDAGLYVQSLALARTVTEAPAHAGALETEAYDLQDMGELPQANRALGAAAAANPSDWTLRLSWAVTLLALGDRTKADQQLRDAEALNPFIRSSLPGPLSALAREQPTS